MSDTFRPRSYQLVYAMRRNPGTQLGSAACPPGVPFITPGMEVEARDERTMRLCEMEPWLEFKRWLDEPEEEVEAEVDPEVVEDLAEDDAPMPLEPEVDLTEKRDYRADAKLHLEQSFPGQTIEMGEGYVVVGGTRLRMTFNDEVVGATVAYHGETGFQEIMEAMVTGIRTALAKKAEASGAEKTVEPPEAEVVEPEGLEPDDEDDDDEEEEDEALEPAGAVLEAETSREAFEEAGSPEEALLAGLDAGQPLPPPNKEAEEVLAERRGRVEDLIVGVPNIANLRDISRKVGVKYKRVRREDLEKKLFEIDLDLILVAMKELELLKAGE